MEERSTEERITIAGPAGALEARWRVPAGVEAPRAVAVLCHPHPLFGGTLHNKTLVRIAKRLPDELRIATLRFNFRGAGASEGHHDDGRGELADSLAAIETASQRFPGESIVVIGYSFGAAIGLRAATADERVTRLIALGLPLRAQWELDFLRRTRKPRFFVQGALDEFGLENEVHAFAATLTGEVGVHIIASAGHLFVGVEDEAVDAVIEYIRAHC